MQDRLAAISLFHSQVGGEVPVMGWVEGALAQAADLRGMGTLLMDVYDSPSWVQDLLEQAVNVEIAFAEAQVEAGADIIGYRGRCRITNIAANVSHVGFAL